MNAMPTEVVRQYLISQGLIGDENATDWASTIGMLPISPDNAISITDTSGILGDKNIDDGSEDEHFGIQVRVRSTDYDIGYKKLDAIKKKLATVQRVSLVVNSESVKFQSFKLTSGIMFMGYEEKNQRAAFSLNGTVSIG